MKVRYIYSACVSIETEDCTVLCDPWFGEAYDGAWAQWPKIEKPLDACGPADYVWISHVHPDHYDPAFLKAYLARYPQAKVIIADHKPALLERKLRARGITPIIIDNLASLDTGGTSLQIFANHANLGVNIDSVLVVSTADVSVANLNDNPYDDVQVRNILHACNGSPTVALLPFVGAGPWPQCYHFNNEYDQLEAAAAKRQKYLDLFARYCQALQPNVAVPFAGHYWLHGPQLDLNPLRGIADATECRKLHPVVWVPQDGGQAVLDVTTGTANSDNRTEPYDWPTVREALEKQSRDKYTWCTGINDSAPDHIYRYGREIQVPVERLPLLKLLQSAVWKAVNGPGGAPRLYLCIKTQLPQWFCIHTGTGLLSEHDYDFIEKAELTPRVEVFIDARYLFGMLTRLYNANSVRIGSLCRFKCVPNVYDKDLDDLFGEFWDSLRV